MTRVVIVGGGFAGLTAARGLARARGVEVTLIDRRNHHLFQPLLYQVAMAGLSPAEIAAPIRALLRGESNVSVRQEEAVGADLQRRLLFTRAEGREHAHAYDYLILACGAAHAYFGRDEWEEFAPGLKSLAQALEIRRRVLSAYERAEVESDATRQRALLTFVVVGAGPTGVELAGALGEMSRFTLARDFRNIDPALARVLLIEAGPRILPSFPEALARRAMRDLEALGVQVWTASPVTRIDASGVEVGRERIEAATTLWAAGVQASPLGKALGLPTDRQGRIRVGPDLALPDHPEVFVLGDQAHVEVSGGEPLPGLAPVAMQESRFVARLIRDELRGQPRRRFIYRDRGQLATIGRSRALCDFGRLRFGGFPAWVFWLCVHIYFLVGFKNRLFVVLQWAWSYLTYGRGARLIVSPEWRQGPRDTHEQPGSDPAQRAAGERSRRQGPRDRREEPGSVPRSEPAGNSVRLRLTARRASPGLLASEADGMPEDLTVLSGGQTGVDRAALRAARECGLACGGWCPPGRESEDGAIPLDLPLQETPEERSPAAPDVPRSLRTEWNVRDSDATLILRPAQGVGPDPGTDWAAACAARYGRPCLVCDPADPAAPEIIARWLDASRIRTLNVAGPSEPSCPGIGERAQAVLRAVFSQRRRRGSGGA